MKFTTKEIPIEKIETNDGQLNGVPKNPRLIKDDRFQRLKKSIADNPEMLALREILVVPYGEKYVALGGNMRLLALRELKHKTVPAKVIPADTPAETLRAYIIKDNVAFGENDFDALANEWDFDELDAFGMELDAFKPYDDEENADDSDNENADNPEEIADAFILKISFDSQEKLSEFMEKHRAELQRLNANVQIEEKQ